MKLNRSIVLRVVVLIALMVSLTVLSTRLQADTGSCAGATTTLPFTDVMGNPFFCQIASAYFSGLANGTSATTYGPSDPVTREQMAAFITRTMDQSLKRGSQRAVAKKWWTPQDANSLGLTDVGNAPSGVAFDGTDLCVANHGSETVMRVRPSDGKVLETWTGARAAADVLVAAGLVFVTSVADISLPGQIFVIDPSQSPGAVTVFDNNTDDGPLAITFDGQFLWTANSIGSITKYSLDGGVETTFAAGISSPTDILWDGENLWVTDFGVNGVHRVDPVSGSVLETIFVVPSPHLLLFDGINLWVSSPSSDTVTVIRAVGSQRGTVLQRLTGNGLDGPGGMAFDGERVLVGNISGNSVSLFKAADFSPLGSVSVGAKALPRKACSDGLNFWITLNGTGKLARF